jgi:heme exporter protein D
MNWNGMDEFLAMGGYALYVWGSVLLSAAALALEVGLLKSRRRTWLRQQARRLRGERKDGR